MKGKVAFAVVAILMLPASTFGAVTMSVTGECIGSACAGDGSSGLSIDGPINAGALSVKISVGLSNDASDTIDGIQWSWAETGTAGLSYQSPSVTNGAVFSASDYQGFADNTGGALAAAFPESFFKGTPGAVAASGNLISYDVTNTGAMAVGDVLTLNVGDAAFGFFTTPSGASPSVGSPLTITVTPEPATALLLVGAIPFLRRRRA